MTSATRMRMHRQPCRSSQNFVNLNPCVLTKLSVLERALNTADAALSRLPFKTIRVAYAPLLVLTCILQAPNTACAMSDIGQDYVETIDGQELQLSQARRVSRRREIGTD